VVFFAVPPTFRQFQMFSSRIQNPQHDGELLFLRICEYIVVPEENWVPELRPRAAS
jgi:hypothetical protein